MRFSRTCPRVAVKYAGTDVNSAIMQKPNEPLIRRTISARSNDRMLFVGLLVKQQPTTFELFLDLKAANSVELTITAAFLAIAEVIE